MSDLTKTKNLSRRRFIKSSGKGVIFFGVGAASMGTAVATSPPEGTLTLDKEKVVAGFKKNGSSTTPIAVELVVTVSPKAKKDVVSDPTSSDTDKLTVAWDGEWEDSGDDATRKIKVEGKAASDSAEDITITVSGTNLTGDTAKGTVVIPHHIHRAPDSGTSDPQKRVAGNATSQPPFLGVAAGQAVIAVAFPWDLSVEVRDQFETKLDDIYNGSDVDETKGGATVSISSISGGKYTDHIGKALTYGTQTEAIANHWAGQPHNTPVNPAPAAGTNTTTLEIAVGGHSLQKKPSDSSTSIKRKLASSVNRNKLDHSITWP